jgi:hypothetical protein
MRRKSPENEGNRCTNRSIGRKSPRGAGVVSNCTPSSTASPTPTRTSLLTGMLIVCARCPRRASSPHCRILAPARTLARRRRRPRHPLLRRLGIVGWYVTSFLVKPNELVREQPYIANNIEMTRQAYGLDRFAQREFPAETTVGATDPANNQPTLQNIRLWDWQRPAGHAAPDPGDSHLLRLSRHRHRSLQIDGTMREVMLARAS